MNIEMAKTKGCPFSVKPVGPDKKKVANRDSNDKPVAMCVADACMSWEFDQNSETEGSCKLIP
jgi:hypothetical protein